MILVRGMRLPSVLVVAVCYCIAAVPLQDYLMIGGLSHSQLSTITLLSALILHWGLYRPLTVAPDATFWARIAMVTALVTATAFSSYSWQAGVDEIRRWGVALLVGYLVAVAPQHRRDVYAILIVLCLAPISAAVYALIQSLRGVGPAAFDIAGTEFTRANGTIGQPNSFAGYMNGSWPLIAALTIWAHKQRSRWRWYLTAGLGLCGIVLVLSFSRGGWFGAAVGLCTMLVVAGGVWRRVAVMVVLAACVVFAGGWRVIPGPIGVRLGSATQIFSAPLIARDAAQQRPDIYAAVERAMQFQAGLDLWRRSPLIGIGPGAYTQAYPDVAYNGWWISRGHAHNAYVQIAAEQGLVGLIAYIYLLWVSTLRGYRLRTHSGILRFAAIGVCATAAAVAGHECFEYLQVNYLPVHLAAVLGLAGVLPRLVDVEDRL